MVSSSQSTHPHYNFELGIINYCSTNSKGVHKHPLSLSPLQCHLQSQLFLVQQAAPYKALLQEKNRLVKENEHLRDQLHTLGQELEQLKSRHTDNTNPPTSSSQYTQTNTRSKMCVICILIYICIYVLDFQVDSSLPNVFSYLILLDSFPSSISLSKCDQF